MCVYVYILYYIHIYIYHTILLSHKSFTKSVDTRVPDT